MIETIKNDSFLPTNDAKVNFYYQGCQLQLPQEFVFLALLDVQNLDLIYKVHDYDNFPHISDLIEEELIEIKLEQQLKRKVENSKSKFFYDIRSIYSNYKWSLRVGKQYHLIIFTQDSIDKRQLKKVLQQLYEVTKEFSIEEKQNKIVTFMEANIENNKRVREQLQIENQQDQKNQIKEDDNLQIEKQNDKQDLINQAQSISKKFGFIYKLMMSSIFIFVLIFIFYEVQQEEPKPNYQNTKQETQVVPKKNIII